MSTFKPVVQAKAAVTLTTTTLTTLGYSVSDVINTTANNPYSVIVEVSATTAGTTITGNAQLVVFAVASLDGTNWSGTTAAASATVEGAWNFVGTVPTPSISQTYTKDFPLEQAFGFVPPYVKLILKNDSGQTLSSESINKAEVFATSVA
jgi:hypothetical protein